MKHSFKSSAREKSLIVIFATVFASAILSSAHAAAIDDEINRGILIYERNHNPDEGIPVLAPLIKKPLTDEQIVKVSAPLNQCYLEKNHRAEAIDIETKWAASLRRLIAKTKDQKMKQEFSSLLLKALRHKKDCQFYLHQTQDALCTMDEYIVIVKDDPDILHDRGVILIELGRHTDALTDLNECLRVLAVREKNIEFKRNFKNQVLHAKTLYDRAKCYRKLGMLQQAERDQQEANRISEQVWWVKKRGYTENPGIF